MALHTSTVRDRQAQALTIGALTADRRLYLDRARARLVEQGDPEAAFLLAAGPGDAIHADEVLKLGLRVQDGRIVQGEQKDALKPADKEAERPADKMIVKPASKRKAKRPKR